MKLRLDNYGDGTFCLYIDCLLAMQVAGKPVYVVGMGMYFGKPKGEKEDNSDLIIIYKDVTWMIKRDGLMSKQPEFLHHISRHLIDVVGLEAALAIDYADDSEQGEGKVACKVGENFIKAVRKAAAKAFEAKEETKA
jgi:hypothetical protein